MPSIFPLSSGITSDVAFAAPVVVGMIDSARRAARRRSLCGRSRIDWSLVYEWIVTIVPCRKPNASLITLTIGTRQFVVHDAFEMMLCCAASYLSELTPITMVMSSPLAGAEMITFLAPAWMCAPALSASVKRPVDSSTTSTPGRPTAAWRVLLGEDLDLVAVDRDAPLARLDLPS
jgi:hypothetical protein